MPQLTLTYFDFKALGEGIRMLLAYGGQEFEDKRITKEEWPEVKPKTLFGQLPMLEVDGKKYSQSLAIARFLGREYGVTGANIEENFDIDQNMDFYTDIRLTASAIHYIQDEKLKAAKHESLCKNYYPFVLNKLDEIIKANNGHLAAGKLTWADFIFAGMYDCLKVILQMPDLAEKYPSFKQLTDNVITLPKVKEYCDKAPKLDF